MWRYLNIVDEMALLRLGAETHVRSLIITSPVRDTCQDSGSYGKHGGHNLHHSEPPIVLPRGDETVGSKDRTGQQPKRRTVTYEEPRPSVRFRALNVRIAAPVSHSSLQLPAKLKSANHPPHVPPYHS